MVARYLVELVSLGFMLSFLLLAIVVDSKFNPLERSREYVVSRRWNWLLVGMLYIGFYSGRYNMSVINNAEVRESMDASLGSYGLCLTLGHFSYAVAMLNNGSVVDRLGGKRSFIFGALGTGAVNAISAVLFGMKLHGIVSLTVANVFNMMFQPFGSLCVVKINSMWYEKEERGVFSGIMGVMIGLGTYLALVGGALVLDSLPFWIVFAKPAVLVGVSATLVHMFVKDRPPSHLTTDEQSRELQDIVADAGRSDVGDDGFESSELEVGSEQSLGLEEEKPQQAQAALTGEPKGFVHNMQRVFQNPALRMLIVCMMCVGWIREGLLSWFTSYLEETFDVRVGDSVHTITSTGITFGGMVGSLGGGYVSDRFFGSKRMKVVFLFFCVETIAVLVLVQTSNEILAAVSICILASMLFGSLTLIIGSAAADYAGKKDAGIASGVLNFSQYISAAFSSLTIGYAVEAGGWGAWSTTLLPAAVLGAASSFFVHTCLSASEDENQEDGGDSVIKVPDEAQLAHAGGTGKEN